MRAALDQAAHHLAVAGARGVFDAAEAKLLVDHAMHAFAVVRLGDEHLDTVALRKTAAVEGLLHGKARAEQADAGQAGTADGGCGGVGDVEQRDVRRGLDGGGHLVHGVGAQHDEVGSGARERLRGRGEHGAGGVPVAVVLQALDLGEVDAVQHDPGRVQAAEAGLHRFVDLAVVRHGGFPAHAAEEADGLHGVRVLEDEECTGCHRRQARRSRSESPARRKRASPRRRVLPKQPEASSECGVEPVALLAHNGATSTGASKWSRHREPRR